MNKLAGLFLNGSLGEVRVHVTELKGRDLVDIRVYSALKEGEAKIPTGKGLSLDVLHVKDLKDALTAAENILRESRLINE